LSKIKDEKIDTILKEIEGTIQAIAKSHEMLYNQDVIKSLDTKEYISLLIAQLEKSYDINNIKIKTNIKANLSLENTIIIGIILNELFTNSIKYAFPNKKQGKIKISLVKKDKVFEFVYSDNGIGFDVETITKSFGLKLVSNLVKNDLKGKLEIESTRQVSFTIRW